MAGTEAPATSAAVYDRLAAPVLAYAERLAQVQGEDMNDLLRHAATLLDRFSTDALRTGAVASTVPPARYTLALVLDVKARTNRDHDVRIWAAGAHRYLFDGRDISVATVQQFIRKAGEAGPAFDGVRGFLEGCLARIEGQRRRFDISRGTNWTGIVSVLIAAFVLAVLGWAGLKEWRYHADLGQVFADEALEIGLDRSGAIPDLAQRLDQLAAASARVKVERDKAPLTLFAPLVGFDAAARADTAYAGAVQRHLPNLLAKGVDLAIATDGDPVALYDTLRAWQILSGQSPWSPAYLSGWAADQAESNPALAGLGTHMLRLAPVVGPLALPDPDMMAQARVFAAEAPEPDRAFLELRRATAVADLPAWQPDQAIPGLADVMQRRSGLPIRTPMLGLFTTAGWDYARDFGAGIAVQTARAEAARLFTPVPPAQNNTPDVLMDRLQAATLARWAALLEDIRVRSFADVDTSVLVSGQLALAKSPLELFLREVWTQSGGYDRKRSHARQLSIAVEFAAMIQYVEQGRMSEIAALFAGLNVALGATDREKDKGQQRLMTVQDRARSVAALRVAPRVVVQIVEDTLAQTGAAHADLLGNPLTRAWQAEALQACTEATAGRFPFAEGPDADQDSVARLLAPDGVIDRFFHRRAEPLLDMREVPWRWKPEARFAGLAPESALFFQHARSLGAGLFGTSGQLDTALTLTALAERGQSFMSIGGQGGPVEATTESLPLNWPGADPAKGIEISFRTPEGEARLTEAGPWGLLRLLAPLRLRERDEGRRFLVDLRSGSARLFLEIGFADAANPLAARGLLKGFACPSVL